MSSEGNMYQSQEAYQHMRKEDTAVYDRLEGSRQLFPRIRDYMINHPDSVTNVSFVGASGAGKETAIGQFVTKLEANKKFQKYLHESGKELDIAHISLGGVMEAADELGWLQSEWGKYSPREFTIASILMRDAVAALNGEGYMQQDSEVDHDPSKIRLVIVESVAVAKPLNLGTAAVKYLGDKPNHFCHALVRNDEVQERARQFRDKIWEDTINPQEIQQTLQEIGSSWDTEIKEGQVVDVRRSMGNSYAIDRLNALINTAIIESQAQGSLPDYLLQVTEETLAENPEARVEGEKALLKHFVHDVWKVRPANAIVAENTVLDTQTVRFFRGKMRQHKVDVIKLLQLQK